MTPARETSDKNIADPGNGEITLTGLDELAFVIDKSPMCIKLFDKAGKMRFINRTGAEEHFLDTAQDVARWDYLTSVTPEFVELVKKGMAAALKGEAGQVEFKHAPGTSTHEWCHGYLMPLKNRDNEIAGVLFSSIDATESRKFADRIKHLEEAQSEFVSVAAHQLLNPITLLRATTELLMDEKEKFTPENREFIETIQQTAINMGDLVNFLLRIVRSDAGKAKFDLVPLDIGRTTAEVMRLLRPELDAKAQRITVSMTPDPFPRVIADGEALRQVIQNLVSNAIRYSPPKSDITIALSLSADVAQFSVQNTGIGIPKNEQQKIFERFYRASNARAEVPQGTGLGLPLAKSFVEAWGGKIWFESEENKGAAFYMTLPVEMGA